MFLSIIVGSTSPSKKECFTTSSRSNGMMSKQGYEVTAQFRPVGNESSLIHTYLAQRSGLVVGTKQAGTKSACVAARRRPPQQVQCRLADILRALASSRMHFRGHNRRRARVRKGLNMGGRALRGASNSSTSGLEPVCRRLTYQVGRCESVEQLPRCDLLRPSPQHTQPSHCALFAAWLARARACAV
ncbi:hypothetical protein M8J77_012995 [Diaphorina citri]|nr:hypothetical protein M8J77_012995 [Diaphorina citri]